MFSISGSLFELPNLCEPVPIILNLNNVATAIDVLLFYFKSIPIFISFLNVVYAIANPIKLMPASDFLLRLLVKRSNKNISNK